MTHNRLCFTLENTCAYTVYLLVPWARGVQGWSPRPFSPKPQSGHEEMVWATPARESPKPASCSKRPFRLRHFSRNPKRLHSKEPLAHLAPDESKWGGSKWDESKWDESKWDESKWDESKWDESKWGDHDVPRHS
jgi:hypothetical protein